MKDLLPP